MYTGSTHAKLYSKFRPLYPKGVYDKIKEFYFAEGTLDNVLDQKVAVELPTAVDVGCGSGQCSGPLSTFCKCVVAVDTSASQLDHNLNNSEKIEFKLGSAEALPLDDGSADIIISGMAAHWFNLPSFYKEADRVLKPGGTIAVFGYSFFPDVHTGDSITDKKLNEIVLELFESAKKYRSSSSELLIGEYRDPVIQIPYTEHCRFDDLHIESMATVPDFVGYLKTRSSINKLLDEEPKYAQGVISKTTQRLAEVLGYTDDLESSSITYRHSIFMLLGRKQS